ncbi:MAG: hypothetical protein U5J83_08070 [Bryobacterales bacterium]|nr:hypothetical protein [Bryobacterales bacterium]
MNNTLNLIRAARGPVQLIVLGVIFLLSYSQVAAVWQTWPVLLISFGLMKLLEWLYQRSLPADASMPGNGGGNFHA